MSIQSNKQIIKYNFKNLIINVKLYNNKIKI